MNAYEACAEAEERARQSRESDTTITRVPTTGTRKYVGEFYVRREPGLVQLVPYWIGISWLRENWSLSREPVYTDGSHNYDSRGQEIWGYQLHNPRFREDQTAC